MKNLSYVRSPYCLDRLLWVGERQSQIGQEQSFIIGL